MTPKDQDLADAIISHSLDLSRLEAGIRKKVIRILAKMQKGLQGELAGGRPLTAWSKARIDALLEQIKPIVGDHFAQVSDEIDIPGIAGATATATGAAIGQAFRGMLSPSLPTDTYLATLASDMLIQGAPSAAWWDKQAADTVFKFSAAVRQGLAAGETNQQIISRVMGEMEVAKRNAAALVQTSVQTVANEARLATFRANSDILNGVRQLSVLDGHTSATCVAYSGAEWDLSGKPINGTRLPFNGGPPRHFNCRSALVGITKTFRELGIDIDEPAIGTRASADGQIRADTTFAEFLDRKGKAFQDEVLGPGRAELWRKKVITLNQLLDQRGNPLTLEELRKKYT